MREGRMNQGWIMEGDRFVGVSLGADHCAEHEWGIARLHRLLGVPAKARAGIARRTVKSADIDPAVLTLHEDGEYIAIICRTRYGGEPDCNKLTALVATDHLPCSPRFTIPKKRKEKPTLDPEWEFSAAWREDAFMLLAHSRFADQVRALHAAALRNDLAVFVGGTSNPFDRGGLILCIVSEVPAKYLKQMRDADLDRDRLEKAAKKSGIHAVLKAGNKDYFALSPRWFSEGAWGGRPVGPAKSKYPVMFWLNPSKQDVYAAGWYTVEELQQWAKDQGPVFKANREKLGWPKN